MMMTLGKKRGSMSIVGLVCWMCIYQMDTVVGYSVQSKGGLGRREMFGVAFGSVATGIVAASPVVANALEICPSSANNCVRTTWTPPSGTSKADAVAAVKAALDQYPQEGQDNVDGGGWTIAEDNLAGAGTARVEFRSSGKGNFAKFFNGGKPFVDDLKIEVEESGLVQIRSQSRLGDSDFGVNSKRVSYLASILKAKGWST